MRAKRAANTVRSRSDISGHSPVAIVVSLVCNLQSGSKGKMFVLHQDLVAFHYLVGHGSKRGQAPLCEAPCGPFRQRCLTPFQAPQLWVYLALVFSPETLF